MHVSVLQEKWHFVLSAKALLSKSPYLQVFLLKGNSLIKITKLETKNINFHFA